MKNVIKRIFIGVIGLMMAMGAHAQLSGGGEANPDLKTNASALENFMDMRYGMFVHFGPASLRGVNIGWSRGQEVTIEDYDSLYKEFNPTLFNAADWVKTAKDAGMKYLILMVKHHDGFCMWDSKYTDYDMGNTPYGKGIVKELAVECKKQGLAFGPYYSISDWHHEGYPVVYPSETYTVETQERVITDPTMKKGMENYITYMKDQIKELVENLDPDILWFNGEYEWPWTHQMGMDLYRYTRSLKEDILINDMLDKGRDTPQSVAKNSTFAGDFRALGLEKGKFDSKNAWEGHAAIGDQWSWKPNDKLKSTKEIIRTLSETVGGDGNLLFNVAPMVDGRIEQRQTDRLKEVGDWLKINGEAVYGTRGGPYVPTENMVSTRNGNKIYLHLYKKESEELTLPFVTNIKVKGAYFLSGKGRVPFTQGKKSITLHLPAILPDDQASIIVLEINKNSNEIEVLQRFNY